MIAVGIDCVSITPMLYLIRVDMRDALVSALQLLISMPVWRRYVTFTPDKDNSVSDFLKGKLSGFQSLNNEFKIFSIDNNNSIYHLLTSLERELKP